MKSFKRYITTSLVAAALLVGCSKESMDGGSSPLNEGEGEISFTLSLGEATRAVVSGGSDEFWGNSTIKLYRKVDSSAEDPYAHGLIREYSPITDMPDKLQLAVGDYKAVVTIGEGVDIFTDEDSRWYVGEEEFTLASKVSSSIEVKCDLQNAVVSVVPEANVAEKFDQRAQFYLTLDDTFDRENVDSYIAIDASQSDNATYLTLEEGKSVTWGFVGESTKFDYTVSAFEGDGVSVDDGARNVVYNGKLTSLEAGKSYSFSFSYKKTPEGYLALMLNITNVDPEGSDESVDFAPQPSIKFTSGDPVSGVMNYATLPDQTELAITSLVTPINRIELEDASGSSVVIFDNGEVKSSIYDGIVSYTKGDDGMSGVMTINKSRYASKPSGAGDGWADVLTIRAADQNNSTGKAAFTVGVEGIVENLATTNNLWDNTATFKALVFDQGASADNVKWQYKDSNASEWIDLATSLEGGFYVAHIAPEWELVTDNPYNTKALEIYKPLGGVFAGNSYDYQVVYDGNVLWSGSDNVGGTQPIPYGNMNDKLSCFGESNGSSTSWASGNNSFTGGLCTQEGGMAKLSSTQSFGVLATGNLVYGTFAMNGTSGTVSFGQKFAWTARPKSFKFDYATTILGKIDKEKNKAQDLHVGDQDIAAIYLAIIEWDSRHSVTAGTSGSPSGGWNPSKQISTNEGKIIGYAYLEIDKQEGSTSNMINKELPIYYYDTDTKPSDSKYSLVISCATSKYGDYMVGCTSNVMYVDNFSFGY